MESMGSWVAPDACTLPTAEQPLRVAEFDALFSNELAEVTRAQSTRLVLDLRDRPGLDAEVADLTARESGCCSFFRFAQWPRGDRLELTIDVPPDQTAVLDALTARAERLGPGVGR